MPQKLEGKITTEQKQFEDKNTKKIQSRHKQNYLVLIKKSILYFLINKNREI